MKELNEEDDFNLSLTPMIDIVFLLLIFFLLATTIAEEERDIQVNIPSGSQGDKKGAKELKRFVIGVRRDGTISLDGKLAAWEELRSTLLAAGAQQDKPQVYLRGDREAHWENVARVLQLCYEARIFNVVNEFRFEAAK